MNSAGNRRQRRTSIQEIGADRVAEFLAKTPLFRGLDSEVAKRLAPHMEADDFIAGEELVSLDPAGTGLAFIASGRAVVSAPNRSGVVVPLYEVKVGDCFNEAAALTGKSGALIATAVEPCRVLEISHSTLEQLLAKIPTFAVSLARRVAGRLEEAAKSSVIDSEKDAHQKPSSPSSPGSDGSIRFVSVSDYPRIESVLELLPRQMIEQFRLLPLEVNSNTLTVGMVDPLDHSALRELQRVQTRAPEIVAISADDFAQSVRRLRLDAPSTGDRSNRVQSAAITFDEHETDRPDANLRAAGDQIVKLAADIVAAGLDRHASDIHLEGDRQAMAVRFRVNGTLTDWGQEVPSYMGKALVARFKVLGGLDITERRRPQDGRIGVRVGTRSVDLRVSTLPSSNGEKLVMRVFEASQMLQGLDQIFKEKHTLNAVRAAIDRPYGAIVVAGPTGSGKSSTLYAALHARRRSRVDSNILTVEDPVEYRLDGVTQVQVNSSIDLGFSEVLRAMLRQDPDVVMVGEIRDSETAHLALEAAMTGHLMFTSIHANDAPSVIQRFESFGCNRSELAQSLALILVQRLARRLCPQCTTTEDVPPILIETLEARRLYDRAKPTPLPRAPGCQACNHTGLAGRIAVVESLVVDDEMRAMLMAEKPLSEIITTATARGSVLRFYQYARHLMQFGLIGPAEALLAVAN